MSSKENFRKQFRPELDVNDILQWVDQDPAYQYKNVIMDYKIEGPKRVERYLDAGWEIVETTENLKDDRSFTANSKKEEKLRPQACISTTSCGHKQILMRILKTRHVENQLKKKQDRDNLSLQNSRKNGETVTRKGNEVITRGSEVSFD